MNNKVKIRSKILKIRESIPKEIRQFKDEQIAKHLEGLTIFKNASHILFYYSHNGEVDTLKLIDKYLDAKQLYLPVIKTKFHLQAIPVQRPLQLNKGFEGIPEPVKASPNSVYDDRIEIVIVPGVAVDKKGNRIGIGKGYYDRYFEKNKKVVKISLAYQEQLLDYCPKDPYDERVDIIVTDREIYKCK